MLCKQFLVIILWEFNYVVVIDLCLLTQNMHNKVTKSRSQTLSKTPITKSLGIKLIEVKSLTQTPWLEPPMAAEL